jgi:hypothetical protein
MILLCTEITTVDTTVAIMADITEVIMDLYSTTMEEWDIIRVIHLLSVKNRRIPLADGKDIVRFQAIIAV